MQKKKKKKKTTFRRLISQTAQIVAFNQELAIQVAHSLSFISLNQIYLHPYSKS